MGGAKPFNIPKRIVWESWKKVRANRGAAGVDEETLEGFERNLKSNLYKLWNRMSSGSYFPKPVKVVEIPKKTGGVRRLGVPCILDRVAQTVVQQWLEPELEAVFHRDSYGYRPGKSALEAIGVTRERCWRYDWVLELDIRGAFDNIDHELLMKAVRKHTSCKWALLYIERWLVAPFQHEKGQQEERVKGTPQGGVISPLLMNLFLHYAFDAWMTRQHPGMPFARYADDGLVHCRTLEEAERVKAELAVRFEECCLELHPDKSGIVYCKDSNRRGKGARNSFDFLGYTFRGRLAKSRANKFFCSFGPAISRESMKRIRATMRSWKIPRRTGMAIQGIAAAVNPVMSGWCNYYGAYSSSIFQGFIKCFDWILLKWVRNKYRSKRGYKKAEEWLKHFAERESRYFVHWAKQATPTVG